MEKTAFQACIQRLTQEWQHLPITSCAQFSQRSRHKRQNYRKILQALDRWKQELQKPRDAAWGKRMEEALLSLLEQGSFLQLFVLSRETKAFFLQATRQFLSDAIAFDESLSAMELFQALRNVWIFLLLELLFQRPLVYHEGIFAYSMLYPYTDNLLDDETISAIEKQQFNDWLMKRLTNTTQQAAHDKVDALITMLEKRYPRAHYPAVYEDLLRIQEGQILSMRQLQPCTQEELLYISMYKGGASVLVDGVLMNGELSEKEAYFCIAYGFLLQLADDLQDVQGDAANHHHTLANEAMTHKQRECFAMHILSYAKHVLYGCYPYTQEAMQAFILTNCERMLLQAMMEDRQRYPYRFQARLRRSFPLRIKDYEACKNMLEMFVNEMDMETILHDYVSYSS